MDAAVIAVAIALGGGVVLTSDPGDLARLAGRNSAVKIIGI